MAKLRKTYLNIFFVVAFICLVHFLQLNCAVRFSPVQKNNGIGIDHYDEIAEWQANACFTPSFCFLISSPFSAGRRD